MIEIYIYQKFNGVASETTNIKVGAPPCGIAPCVVVVSGSADAEVDAVVSSVLDVK